MVFWESVKKERLQKEGMNLRLLPTTGAGRRLVSTAELR